MLLYVAYICSTHTFHTTASATKSAAMIMKPTAGRLHGAPQHATRRPARTASTRRASSALKAGAGLPVDLRGGEGERRREDARPVLLLRGEVIREVHRCVCMCVCVM